MRAALRCRQRIAGLLLLAPAVDFTVAFWRHLTEEQRQSAVSDGTVRLGSQYVTDGSDVVRIGFFRDAERQLLLCDVQNGKINDGSGQNSSDATRASNVDRSSHMPACDAAAVPSAAASATVQAARLACTTQSSTQSTGAALRQLCCPVGIIHGRCDDVIALEEAQRLADVLGANVTLHTVDDGDHRLSRPQDLGVMVQLLDELVAVAGSSAALNAGSSVA